MAEFPTPDSQSKQKTLVAGLIADTHGLLRPEVARALAGVEVILHAGDVGHPDVLPALEQIAPVWVVRGNIDRGPWAERLPQTQVVELGGKLIYMVHDLLFLDLNPRLAGFAAVVSGHTHRPLLETREGVLYINPGSAGPRRFRLPVSVARLVVAQGELAVEVVELEA
jgi:uncharacterized protein